MIYLFHYNDFHDISYIITFKVSSNNNENDNDITNNSSKMLMY